MNSEDLRRLAEWITGRITLRCPKCNDWRKLTLELRELRFGSSPDLSEIDARFPGKPRLVFWCSRCQRMIGYVQGDEWTAPPLEGDPEVTRWDRLEIDQDDPDDR